MVEFIIGAGLFLFGLYMLVGLARGVLRLLVAGTYTDTPEDTSWQGYLKIALYTWGALFGVICVCAILF
jgi:hypothetical protein